jgi:hypothetical protein
MRYKGLLGSPGAQAERPGDEGPVRSFLGGKASSADSLNDPET